MHDEVRIKKAATYVAGKQTADVLIGELARLEAEEKKKKERDQARLKKSKETPSA